MSRLDELIAELCPNGVVVKKLCEVSYMQRGTSLTKAKAVEGDIPVISGGKVPAFYCNSSNRDGETITVAGSGAGAGYVQYWDIPIFANDCFTVKGNEFTETKYLYYFMTNIQDKISDTKKGGGVPHVHISDVENFRLPVPPLEVQREIISILDSFELLTAELAAELTAELVARKKQYNFYKERLLTFGNNTLNCKLKDICDIFLGLTSTPNYTDAGVKFISAQNTSNDFLDLSNVKYISETDFEKATPNAKPQKGDLLFTRVGSNLGHPVVVETDEKLCIFVSLGFLRIRNKEQVIIGYLKHWMNTDLFWSQVRKNVHGAAKVNLNTGWLKEFSLSLPSLEIQKKIVHVLDNFESICTDLNIDLPAEIEARQKQYEYYLKSVYLIATRDLSNLWLQFFLSQNQGFMRLFEKTVLK